MKDTIEFSARVEYNDKKKLSPFGKGADDHTAEVVEAFHRKMDEDISSSKDGRTCSPIKIMIQFIRERKINGADLVSLTTLYLVDEFEKMDKERALKNALRSVLDDIQKRKIKVTEKRE